MSKSVLVILTVTFPYKGEYFLNEEIFQLKNTYDEIHIVPTNVARTSKLSCISLPTNVIVKKIGGTSWIKRIFYMIEMIPLVLRELLFVRNATSLMKIIYRWIASSKVRQFLNSHYLDNGDPSTNYKFYSYWLNANALAIGYLPEGYERVARAHGSDIYGEYSKGGINPFQSSILNRVDKVYCISEHGRSYLTHRYPKWKSKIQLSRLGVRLSSYTAPTAPALLDCNEVELISCSRIDDNKRVIELFSIVKILIEKGILSKWCHIGDGPRYSELLKAIENEPCYIKQRIDLTGFVENSKVRSVFKGLRNKKVFFINISKSEGIPVSIMDAMAEGIPTIATSVGGVPEIIDDCVNGFLINGSLTGLQFNNTVLDIVVKASLISVNTYMDMSYSSHKKISESYNSSINFQCI